MSKKTKKYEMLEELSSAFGASTISAEHENGQVQVFVQLATGDALHGEKVLIWEGRKDNLRQDVIKKRAAAAHMATSELRDVKDDADELTCWYSGQSATIPLLAPPTIIKVIYLPEFFKGFEFVGYGKPLLTLTTQNTAHGFDIAQICPTQYPGITFRNGEAVEFYQNDEGQVLVLIRKITDDAQRSNLCKKIREVDSHLLDNDPLSILCSELERGREISESAIVQE